jgi:adenine phosphoribosyltransferase
MKTVEHLIRVVPDFPKPGILFRDITPLLEDPAGFSRVIEVLAKRYEGRGINKIVGVESRGFIFGAALAVRISAGLVLARKPGKLPRETHSASYALEYGEDSLEIHRDAIGPNDKSIIVDDLLATGGTAKATCDLISSSGAEVHEVAVVIELAALSGRSRVNPVPVHSLLTY